MIKNTVGAQWRAVQRQFAAAGLNPAPREGQQVVAFVLGVPLAELFLHEDKILTDLQIENISRLTAQRAQGQPLAYVLGVQPFWQHDWLVGKGVLIPRPDSEIVVREALARIPALVPQGYRVAEVGLGSGALLGSILQARPDVQGVGTELDAAVLATAHKNLAGLGVIGRATLMQADILAGVAGPLALILSNPPYLSEAEYAELESAVRDYEPHLALVGGVTGLEFYQKLVPQALKKLTTGGWLVVEIGHTQGAAVQALFTAAGFTEVTRVPDLAHRDRVVAGRKA
jgi:release factor glutamine methyltransferase